MINIKSINKDEALRYMGYNKNINIDNIMPMLENCEKRLLSVINPRFSYKIYDIYSIDSNSIAIKNSSLIFKSKDIASHLENCDKAVFMAATLSNTADRLICEYQIKDMTSALISDAMASAAIEQVCNQAEEIIKESIESYYMTWRFSPGYGDLSIEYQKDFITLTDAQRKIGLTLTISNLLIPAKSVTAVIGLSKEQLPKKRRGCAICNMSKNCQFRNRGEHCGF